MRAQGVFTRWLTHLFPLLLLRLVPHFPMSHKLLGYWEALSHNFKCYWSPRLCGICRDTLSDVWELYFAKIVYNHYSCHFGDFHSLSPNELSLSGLLLLSHAVCRPCLQLLEEKEWLDRCASPYSLRCLLLQAIQTTLQSSLRRQSLLSPNRRPDPLHSPHPTLRIDIDHLHHAATLHSGRSHHLLSWMGFTAIHHVWREWEYKFTDCDIDTGWQLL